MFYSITFSSASSDGAPLRYCWLASHGRKLKKHDVASFSIPSAAKMIMEPDVALSLRCATFQRDAFCASLEQALRSSPGKRAISPPTRARGVMQDILLIAFFADPYRRPVARTPFNPSGQMKRHRL